MLKHIAGIMFGAVIAVVGVAWAGNENGKPTPSSDNVVVGTTNARIEAQLAAIHMTEIQILAAILSTHADKSLDAHRSSTQ
jgi:hypothetical protein